MLCVRLLSLIALCGAGCGGLERYEGAAPVPASDPGPGPGTSATATRESTVPTAGAAGRADLEGAEVFLGVAEFEAARTGGATVLDARDAQAYGEGHVPGAVHAPWERFVDGDKSGLLSEDLARLQGELSRAGVSAARRVLVYGNWDEAWGEEGRIFWMLEYFGHRDVRVLSGGVNAYRDAGHALSVEVPTTVAPGGSGSVARPGAPVAVGDFVIAPRPELRATAEQVHTALERGDAVILDIRTLAEYDGLSPHGAARGGHIPTAVHYHWRDVFGESGALLARETVRARFAELGIADDTLVIAYCTGGIRSGFIYAVMRWVGYAQPRNYDGSWWEWSSRQELPVER